MLSISRKHKQSIQFQVTPWFSGWRVKHDAEMPMAWRVALYGDSLRANMPEVYILSETVVYMDERIQRLSKDINPQISGLKWRAVYANQTAFTNNSGFDGPTPCADFINRRDVNQELPAFDKVRVCGGAFVKGFVDGNALVVNTLNPADLITVDWLLAHPEYTFHAVNTNPGGISKFPQGNGMPVLIPLFSRYEARIPLAQVEKWDSDQLPDPYTIYHPVS